MPAACAGIAVVVCQVAPESSAIGMVLGSDDDEVPHASDTVVIAAVVSTRSACTSVATPASGMPGLVTTCEIDGPGGRGVMV